MGTITERKRKNGSIGYYAQVVIGPHRESKTFHRKQVAQQWIIKREKELRGGESPSKPRTRVTLSDAIDRYTSESRKEIGRTKAQNLKVIKGYDIASRDCASITGSDITQFVTQISKGRHKATVASYLSSLSSVFNIAKPAWGYDLNPQAIKDAFIVGKSLGTVGKGGNRERRPTMEELDKMISFFKERRTKYPDMIPMDILISFALFGLLPVFRTRG